MRYFGKKSTTDLVIAKLKYLTFEPALGVKGWGKTCPCHAHLQALGNHGL